MNGGIYTALPPTKEAEMAQKPISKHPETYIEKPASPSQPQPISLADVVDQLLLTTRAEGVAKNAKAAQAAKMMALTPIPTEGGVPMLIIDSIGSMTPGMGIDPTLPVGQEGGKPDVMMEQAKHAPQIKSLIELVPGQSFSAEILDIKPGSVTLQMGDGMPLTARSMIVPDARIGDIASFIVKETKPGQISLEFMRGGFGNSQVPSSIITEALTASNMQHTASNASLVVQMVENNMGVDPSTLQRAAFFNYSLPDAPFKHIQFLLDNNFAPTDRTVEMFQGMLKGEMTLTGELAEVKALIDSPEFAKASQSPAWEGLVSQLKNLQVPTATAGEGQPIQLPQPGEYLEQLRSVAQEISKLAQQEGQTELAGRAANVADIVDFSRNITDTKAYYQFPFIAVGEEKTAELHVFKKKGSKDRTDKGKHASALIALDTGFLGRVEVFVQKNDRNVNVQFRSDTGETLKTVNVKGHELSDLLKETGYIMTSLKTKKINEAFDITKTGEDAEPTKFFGKGNQTPEAASPKRYSFDVRV
ncbi:MAG: flagellar hook-length control protein FliK [Defluviitaleaceae bacterium]|nr:flagellar hook-length control protein FliK [Defluviitaleaceae bacterium]